MAYQAGQISVAELLHEIGLESDIGQVEAMQVANIDSRHPAGTPTDVVKKLSDALLRALDTPDVKAKLAAQEVQAFPLSSAEFGALIRKETPMWTDLVLTNKLMSD